MNEQAVNILVALPAEAKPLIKALALHRQQPDGIYPRYLFRHTTLLLTGPGSQAMEAGVNYLYRLQNNSSAFWLNIGIAGHASLSRGSCLSAGSVFDEHSGGFWHLPLIQDPGLTASPLRCVTAAESDYSEDAAYDMESAGFVLGLEGIGALQQGRILKVVSDNPRQPTTEINGRMVGQLIGEAIPTISSILGQPLDHA